MNDVYESRLAGTRRSTFKIGERLLNPSGGVPGQALALQEDGTIALSDVNEASDLLEEKTANTVFAAPDGTDGAPTFRTLVDDDIPGALTINGGSINGTVIGDTKPAGITTNNLFVTSDHNTYSVRFTKDGRSRALIAVDIDDATSSLAYNFRSWDASGNLYTPPLALNPVTGVTRFRGTRADFDSVYVSITNADKPSAKSGSALLYVNGGELFTKDAAGNETQLSSHVVTEDETSDFAVNEVSGRTGYRNHIDVVGALRWIEAQSGNTYIHSEQVAPPVNSIQSEFNERKHARAARWAEWIEKHDDL